MKHKTFLRFFLSIASQVALYAHGFSLAWPTRTSPLALRPSTLTKRAISSIDMIKHNEQNDQNTTTFHCFTSENALDSNNLLSFVAMTFAMSAVFWSATALPVSASTASVFPGALYAYGHYLSIMAITGLLAAERILIKPDMSSEEEDLVMKLDIVYGLMAALLIGSGVARANANGDFYIHEVLFWIKMVVSGFWGGLSIFPSLTFYRRNLARKNDENVPSLSETLAKRLQQIINAELSAILTIPILATFMARGVSYWQDLSWPLGLAVAITCTGGSFFVYGKQALTWEEEKDCNDGKI